MKLSDIPELPILEFLAKNPTKWHFWWPGEFCMSNAFPPNTPDKIQLRKMGKLISRGLVSGCDCGCRGDFHITEKGLKALAFSKPKPHDPYKIGFEIVHKPPAPGQVRIMGSWKYKGQKPVFEFEDLNDPPI